MASKSLYDGVLNQVGLAVVSGELEPGTKLVLSDIEQRYEVSRTVARDVVKVVESLGLVTSRRRAGIEIQPQASWRVLDPLVIAWRIASDRQAQIASLTEVRSAVEPRAARLAAEHATQEQAARLVETASTMAELGARGLGLSKAYLEADIEFHTLLLVASANEMFGAMQGMIADVLRGRHDYQLTPEWPDSDALAEHVRIAQAVTARDPEAAEAASRRQLEIVFREVAGRDQANDPGVRRLVAPRR